MVGLQYLFVILEHITDKEILKISTPLVKHSNKLDASLLASTTMQNSTDVSVL